MKQIHAAEMRQAIRIEFDLYFCRAIGHTEKAYNMDGFSVNLNCCKRTAFRLEFNQRMPV